MRSVTLFELYGSQFQLFWEKVELVHPDIPQAYYEVYVDFMDDIYDDRLPLEDNVEMAYRYILNHQNDYD